MAIRVPHDHPALAGHFPGRPVVPGVVLLDEVLAALPGHVGREVRVSTLGNVKFLAPLLPGQDCEIRFVDKGVGAVSFSLWHEQRQIASGSIHYETARL